MKKNLLILFLLSQINLFAQTRSDNWYFGDSAGVKFIGSTVVPLTGNIVSVEASASISDLQGNLLFYVSSNTINGLRFYVYNHQNQLMQNGDSLFGYAFASQAAIIIPSILDSTKYIIIHTGFVKPGGHPAIFYSIVDMALDSGKGAVVSKNNLIDSTYIGSEQMIAVKHGNGRDWWLVSHEENNDIFLTWLMSNDSISGPFLQTIGSIQYAGINGQMAISPYGDKLYLADDYGAADLFDFDRCSGLLSNWKYIGDSLLSADRYYGACFSAKNLLYYGTRDSIWQIDATDSFPLTTKTLIYVRTFPDGCFGQLQMGPDNKIYMVTARGVNCSGPNNIFDSINQNLSVITLPDVSGIGCNIQPYSVSLGNHRCFIGLPNIPFYDLGVLQGSVCDTLTGIAPDLSPKKIALVIYPNPNNGSFNISIDKVLRGDVTVTVYDAMGKAVFKKIYREPTGSYFNKQVNINGLSKGVYQISVNTERELLITKFIKL